MSEELYRRFDSIKNRTEHDAGNYELLSGPLTLLIKRFSTEFGFTKVCAKDHHIVYEYNSVKVELFGKSPYFVLSAFPAKFNCYDDYMKNANSNCLDIESYLKVILLDGRSSKLDYKEEVRDFLDNEHETGGVDNGTIKSGGIKNLLNNHSIVPVAKIMLDLFDFAVDTDINKFTNGYAYL